MPKRIIRTKQKLYELPIDQQDIPVEEYFAGVDLPELIKASGSKVYHTADGPVIAIPSSKKRRAVNRRARICNKDSQSVVV